jgi:uncharacterized protein YkwD
VAFDATIATICQPHSDAMSTGTVPLGHAGASERFRQVGSGMACENVFFADGIDSASVASAAVDGWIHSPGHRRNLLSHTRRCGVALTRSGKGWFVTQIFAS